MTVLSAKLSAQGFCLSARSAIWGLWKHRHISLVSCYSQPENIHPVAGRWQQLRIMDSRIESVVLLIAKNFRNNLVLGGLAKDTGLSKFHFHRLFKAEMGITPLAYINKLKLEHATHFLIMYPDSKQLDVAFETGYSSPAVFARAFKQAHDCSPMEFRQKKLGAKKIRPLKSANSSPIEITYLKQKRVFISQSNLLESNLSSLYKKLIDRIDKPIYSIGFYLDTPMHVSLDQCRYFAGIEDEKLTKTQAHFDIEEGYYTYFNMQGDFDVFIERIVEYKEKIIDPSPYQISSFVGFEKIKLSPNQPDFDYFSATRTLYLKIKHQ